jgi:antitoxin VapB
METTKLFMSGRSQAVRLPKAYRIAGTEVFIKKVGNAIVLIPETDPWETLFECLDLFEPGFRIEREQPIAQQKRLALAPKP